MRNTTPLLIGAVLAIAVVQACGKGWTDAHEDPAFPLRGKHLDLTCDDCHSAPSPLPVACEGCHEADRPEVHDDGGCGDCHSEEGWGVIDHSFFPLQDSHDLECTACHSDGYDGLDPACTSCHEADRPADHFVGQDCVACHRPTTWADATFDHSFFALEDAHDLDCVACHGEGGDYTGLDSACAFCHEGDRPVDHFVGQDCVACHTATLWQDGEFDHQTLFPLPHRGVDDCAACHLYYPDTSSFSCIDCHEHSRANTDSHHGEVSDYSYDSDACVRCHPDGRVHDD